MAFQFDVATRNATLDAMETHIGVSPTLEIRSGAVPANAAAADSGTVLATINLPADWAAAAASGAKTFLGTWQDAAADAGGIAGHFRIKAAGTCKVQGIVSMAWQASKAVVVGEYAHNGGSVYRCSTAGTTAGSGGPTGAGASISDGSAVWAFVQVGTDMAFDNNSIGVNQQVNITAFTLTAGGA
jgi:hypothetical protein